MSDLTLDDGGVVVTCGTCGQRNRFAYGRLDDDVRCGKCKAALPAPSAPIEVDSSAHFDRLIASASIPVVVDFWAPWCAPCRMVAPELEKVAKRQAGKYLVVKVNTDAHGDLGERFGIRSIPTMAVFAGGREAARTSGARPAAEIEAFAEQASGKGKVEGTRQK
ncbi:MAG: thioredoxin [Acidobacteriota bacterium]